uniref:Uncharacterized protein n=1 Tax=Plectus sambesii TaxID=2011161 RepID=A0A914UJX8_9BILA
MQIYPNHHADGKPYDDNQIQVKVAAVVGSVWPDRAILWSDQLGRLYFPFKNKPQSMIALIQSKHIVQVTCHHIRPKIEDCHWEVSAANFASKSAVAPTEFKATTAKLHNAWRHWEVILKEEKAGVVAAKENTFYMGLPDYYMSVQSLIDVMAVHQHFDVLVAPTQIHVTTNWRAFYAHPIQFEAAKDGAYGDELSLMSARSMTPIIPGRVHILTRSRSQDDTKQVDAKFQFLEQELSQLWHETGETPADCKVNGTWTPSSAPTSALPSPRHAISNNDSSELPYSKHEILSNGLSAPPSPTSPSSSDVSEANADSYYEQLKIAKQLLKEIVDDKEFFEKLCTKPQLVRRVTMFVFNKV